MRNRLETLELGVKPKDEPGLNGHDKMLSADDVFSKYHHLQITDATQIPQPIPVLKINGEIISTEGNITTVSGASKSGKTAFVNVVITGAIAEGEYDGFPSVDVTRCMGKAVLHFDTEQARHKHQKNLTTILKRAGFDHCPDNFLSYNIRQEEIESYEAITEQLMGAAFEKFGGIQLTVIDGGADYLGDVNDPTQSNMIIKFFEEMAIKYSTAIIIICHVNPGSDKERGHFGSQLQRKSESVLGVRTVDDVSCLEPKLLRMAGKGDIPLIQFEYDKEKGYHVYCGIKPAMDPNEKDSKRLQEIKDLAEFVFAYPAALHYQDAINGIMRKSKRGERTSKEFFKEMKAHEMIMQGEDKKWSLYEEIKEV